MSQPVITAARPFILPEATGLARDFTRPPEGRSPHYLQNYDRTTLWYDCVHRPETGEHVFTAPAFLNLWPVFRKGLRREGQPVRRLVRRNFVKCEQVIVRAPEGSLSLRLGDQDHPVAARQTLAPLFAGLNAAVTLNRDNHLDWIRDWARYYVSAHGLQGVMLFDNASRSYPPEDIAETLAAAGIARVAVMQVPFKYGPVDGGNKLQRPNFLQPCILNLARLDALSRARAVLNVDIDEIVRPLSRLTVFDAAVGRRHSMVKIHGSWIYPEAGAALPAAQAAHRHRAQPNKRCNQKWCAVPTGLLSRLGWATHHVGGELVRLIPRDPRFELLHCRGASTGWKAKRFNFPSLGTDADLAAFMDAAFAGREAHP